MTAGGYDLRPRQLRALLILLVVLPLLPSAVMVRFFIDAARYESTLLGENWSAFYASYAKALAGYAANQARREFAELFDEYDGDPRGLCGALSARSDVEGVLLFSKVLETGGEVWRDGQRDPSSEAPALLGMIGPLRAQGATWSHWRRLQGTGLFGRVFEGEDWWLVVLRDPAVIEAKLTRYIGDSVGSDITWMITTADKPPVFPSRMLGEGSVSQPLDSVAEGWVLWVGSGETSPRWNTGLGEQIRLYQQVSLLMLGAVLTVGIVAGWAITRQIRLQDIRSSALATVAHELKTPIASSKLLIETLESRKDKLDNDLRDYIPLLGSENARLANVVSDFLLFSKIEQKRYQPKQEVIPVKDIISEALDAVRSSLQQSGTHLLTHLPESPLHVRGERNVLARALVNLIENAIKHSGKPGVVEVVVRQSSTRHIDLLVCDKGDGIPPRELRRIFRPFHQADNKLSRSHEGAGLGLSIVKQIVAAHGGKVWAESDGLSGATFIIRLPLAKPAQSAGRNEAMR